MQRNGESIKDSELIYLDLAYLNNMDFKHTTQHRKKLSSNHPKDMNKSSNFSGATVDSLNPMTIKQQIKEHWNNFYPKLPEKCKNSSSPRSMKTVYQAKRIVM
jgi:hypothetical protein